MTALSLMFAHGLSWLAETSEGDFEWESRALWYQRGRFQQEGRWSDRGRDALFLLTETLDAAEVYDALSSHVSSRAGGFEVPNFVPVVDEIRAALAATIVVVDDGDEDEEQP